MRFSMPSSCASLVYDIFQCFFWRRLLFICACFMRGFSLYQPGRSPCLVLGALAAFFAFARESLLVWFCLRFHEGFGPILLVSCFFFKLF
jgi:hypothetical protein